MPRHPQVSPRVSAMQGSVFSALAHRLAAYKGEVYPLHVGDTWMEPAEGCRMEDLSVEQYPGMHKYSSPQGHPMLLDTVVEVVGRRSGVPTERSDVLISAGATGGLAMAVGAVVQPGDEVLILAPFWPLIRGIVQTYGGVAVPVPFFGETDSPETAIEAVEAARTERTVAVYWNTPNNPTGRVIPPSWLEALVAWAQKNDLWILADEVYEVTQFTGDHVYSRALAPERTFAAHSFSKAYGMAGNRCGYLVGPTEVMSHAVKIGVHSFYSTPTASQLAAARLLQGPADAWADHARAAYHDLGQYAAERLGKTPPEGSTFLFFDVAEHLDDRGLMGFLEDCVDRGLFVSPGPSFGPYPTHVRVCFTSAPPDVVRRGIDVLAGLIGR